MIGSLIQKSSQNVKEIMEDLLNGKSFRTRIGEQIVCQQLDYDETAIFSLLLASGYLKILASDYNGELGEFSYELVLTNKEVSIMFRRMVEEWCINSDFPLNLCDLNYTYKQLMAIIETGETRL